MEIVHDQKYQQFSIKMGDDEAELAYSQPEDGIISFDHTYVPEAGRGKGISEKMIRAGLQFAEDNNLKVQATCPVVQAFLKRHPEFSGQQQK